MLSAAGSLRWLRDAVAPGVSYDELVAEAGAWPAGTEGLLFLPYLAGERTPHADPDARGAFVGLEHAPRPRRARSRRPRGRRVRAARLARPGLRARRPAGPRARVRRRRAQRAVAADRLPRCSSCRSSASPSTRARRSARRSSAASRPGYGPTFAKRSRRRSSRASSIEPVPRVGGGLSRAARALPRALPRAPRALASNGSTGGFGSDGLSRGHESPVWGGSVVASAWRCSPATEGGVARPCGARADDARPWSITAHVERKSITAHPQRRAAGGVPYRRPWCSLGGAVAGGLGCSWRGARRWQGGCSGGSARSRWSSRAAGSTRRRDRSAGATGPAARPTVVTPRARVARRGVGDFWWDKGATNPRTPRPRGGVGEFRYPGLELG